MIKLSLKNRLCALKTPRCLGSVVLALVAETALAEAMLDCRVAGTDDRFIVYPHQRIYRSDSFDYYQLMQGLTVLVVHRQTRQFNRLSNLNLLPSSSLDPQRSAEPYQFFNGQCTARVDE